MGFFRRIFSVLVITIFLSACASGEGPYERSGQENYGRIGAGVGGAAGVIAGAAIGGRPGAILGGIAGAVVGGLLGSGVGGAVRSNQDPKMLCDEYGEDIHGQPCRYDNGVWVPNW